MLKLYGTQTGVNLARKHIGWYTKGLPGSAELRNNVNQQDDPAVVVRMLQEFYSPWLARSAACAKQPDRSVLILQRPC
jgi:tRNA-dihydrouridine synthase B